MTSRTSLSGTYKGFSGKIVHGSFLSSVQKETSVPLGPFFPSLGGAQAEGLSSKGIETFLSFWNGKDSFFFVIEIKEKVSCTSLSLLPLSVREGLPS